MKIHYRKGFTLLEVAVALAIAASAMVWTYSLIAKGMQLQREAIHVSNAVNLARVKMSQLDSSTKLQTDTSSGPIPGYPGYAFETEVIEEEMDLLKMSGSKESKEQKKKAPSDLLGNGDKKLNTLIQNRAGNKGSETGGLLKVFKIKVTITYPSMGRSEKYVVTSMKSAKY
jgi:general secretion pathway protein I